MRHWKPLFALLALLFWLGSVGTLAGDREFVGSGKCKTCHKKEESGAQYPKWEETAHAKAFETLKSEESQKIAAEKGLKVPAHEAPECLKCHTTGYGKGGYEVKDASFYQVAEDDKEGKKAVKRMEGLQAVGCETCHGAGGDYKDKKTMKAIFDGEVDGASVGLIQPNKELCVTCHNEESPTFKGFDYEKASKEVSHPYPEGYRK